MKSLNEIQQNLKELDQRIDFIAEKKNISVLEEEVVGLKTQTESGEFWADNMKAQKVMKRISSIEDDINSIKDLKTKLSDISTMIELYSAETQDASESAVSEVEQMFNQLVELIDKVETKTYLNGKFDESDAILSINAGQGGTEAEDWTEMLLRMYLKYFQRVGFDCEIVDKIAGNEAGIASVTMEVREKIRLWILKKRTWNS